MRVLALGAILSAFLVAPGGNPLTPGPDSPSPGPSPSGPAATPQPTTDPPPPPGGEPIPNSYIVTLKVPDGTSDPAAWTTKTARDLTDRAGGKVESVYTVVLQGFSASMSADQAAAMRRDPRVAKVEQDTVIEASSANVETASPQPSPPWHLDRIDQPNHALSGTYDYDADGANVTIYVIDSGIRASHQEFGGRVRTAPHPLDGADCGGHGTAVAGVAAGATLGVAKKATVYSVKGFDCDDPAASKTLDAIEWVTQHARGPAVVNVSLAGLPDVVETAMRNSIKTGITYVVAAGNMPRDTCDDAVQRLREAIVVGATEPDDNVAGYSSYGPCLDLYAPGSDLPIVSWDNDTAVGTASGSSLAAPIVAGAAALYLSKHPDATPSEVEAALVGCATTHTLGDLPPTSPDRLVNARCPRGLTVTNPGVQRTTVGQPVRLDKLKVSGAASGATLQYRATGLPAGLRIDGATGVISGTLSERKATTVEVTVTDGKASTSTTFRWEPLVGYLGYGHVTAGDDTCLDSPSSSKEEGQALQVWGCNQSWAVRGDGSIQFEKTDPAKCVSASDQTTPDGPRVVLSTCTGADTQIWRMDDNGRLVNAATGKCLSAAQRRPGTPIVLADCTGALAVQKWKLPDKLPDDFQPDHITFTELNGRTTLKDARARVRAVASTNDTTANLRYSASGLPKGLSINADTGLISGTATVTGTSKVEVTATGPNGRTASATFRWQVADGPIIGLDGGCVDNGNDSTVAQMYGCNYSQAQLWTIRSDGRLEAARRCMAVAGRATTGSPVVMVECDDSSTLVWQHKADGTLRTAADLCLTAPHSSWRTQLTVTRCTGSGNQVWQLPPEPSASMTNPGRRDMTLFSDVDLETAGTKSRRYAATGLPSGLSIDADTGVITGRTDQVGSGTAIVTASDASGVTDRIAFSWGVHHGLIRGKKDKCLEVRDYLGEENSPIEVKGCSGWSAQLWTVHSDGTLEAIGKCLTVGAKADDADPQIVLRTCGDGDNQQWRQQPDGTLRNPASGKCLTGSSDPDAEAVLSACAAGDTQQWRLPPTDQKDPEREDPPQNGEDDHQEDEDDHAGDEDDHKGEDTPPGYGAPGGITHSSGSWCADVRDGAVGVWDCNGTRPQTWMINADGRVLNQQTEQCLTPEGSAKADGTRIVVAPCAEDDKAQEWRQQPDGTVRNVASGRCLSAEKLSYLAPMTLADCAADDRQRWKLPTL